MNVSSIKLVSRSPTKDLKFGRLLASHFPTKTESLGGAAFFAAFQATAADAIFGISLNFCIYTDIEKNTGQNIVLSRPNLNPIHSRPCN